MRGRIIYISKPVSYSAFTTNLGHYSVPAGEIPVGYYKLSAAYASSFPLGEIKSDGSVDYSNYYLGTSYTVDAAKFKGSSEQADKLTGDVGTAYKPIYLKDGVPTVCTGGFSNDYCFEMSYYTSKSMNVSVTRGSEDDDWTGFTISGLPTADMTEALAKLGVADDLETPGYFSADIIDYDGNRYKLAPQFLWIYANATDGTICLDSYNEGLVLYKYNTTYTKQTRQQVHIYYHS